jgi:hypothetical protein
LQPVHRFLRPLAMLNSLGQDAAQALDMAVVCRD